MMLPSNLVTRKSARVRSQSEKGTGTGSMKKNYSAKLRSIGKDIHKLLHEVENEALKDQTF